MSVKRLAEAPYGQIYINPGRGIVNHDILYSNPYDTMPVNEPPHRFWFEHPPIMGTHSSLEPGSIVPTVDAPTDFVTLEEMIHSEASEEQSDLEVTQELEPKIAPGHRPFEFRH